MELKPYSDSKFVSGHGYGNLSTLDHTCRVMTHYTVVHRRHAHQQIYWKYSPTN